MTPAQREKEVERLRKIGKKGGKATKRLHGKSGHFKKAGQKGGKARWRMDEAV